MVVFDSSYLIIRYDESLEAITEEWKLDFTQTVQEDKFRQPLEKLLEEFSNKKAKKWLCDNTEQKTLLAKDQLWLENYFYPQLFKRGLKAAALVNAKHILGTGYAKNCLQNVDDEILQIEVFNKNKEAREWLKKA